MVLVGFFVYRPPPGNPQLAKDSEELETLVDHLPLVQRQKADSCWQHGEDGENPANKKTTRLLPCTCFLPATPKPPSGPSFGRFRHVQAIDLIHGQKEKHDFEAESVYGRFSWVIGSRFTCYILCIHRPPPQ